MNKAQALKARFEKMQANRANWDTIWQLIAQRTDPKNAVFTQEPVKGQPGSAWRKFDSTATLAVPKWSAAIDGLTTPKTQKWHDIVLSDEQLTDRFRPWLEQVRDALFARRYAAGSNFTLANLENLRSIGAYGSGPFTVTEDFEGGCIYKAWPLREFYVEQNFQGDVDVFFRKFKLTARQAKQQFGEKCPQKVKDCKDLTTEYEFLHAVYPNTDYDPSSLLGTKKKYASVYTCLTTEELVEEGGYDVLPFLFPRYDVMPNLQDPYGYSPLMLCMPEVKDLNAMVANNLKVGERVGNPAILMSEDDLLERRSFRNGALIPGGLDSNGRPRAQALNLPGNVPFTLEMLQDFRNVINESFNLNLFQILVNKPDMTATEVLQRAQEQATLLAPTTSRREREFLAPLIKKETEIAYKQGALPPMPMDLQEALGSGEVYLKVEYESPIRRAQRADDGQAIMRTIEAATALQQFDPTVKNKINGTRTLEELAQVWGAPYKIFNDDEEKAALDMNDQQLQQAAQMLQAAPVLGKTAKDMAEAQAKGGLNGGI